MNEKFNWWVLVAIFAVVGYFGIFWTLNIANAEFEIKTNMDNNTLLAVQSFERISDALSESQSELNCLKGCLMAEQEIVIVDAQGIKINACVNANCLEQCKDLGE